MTEEQRRRVKLVEEKVKLQLLPEKGSEDNSIKTSRFNADTHQSNNYRQIIGQINIKVHGWKYIRKNKNLDHQNLGQR